MKALSTNSIGLLLVVFLTACSNKKHNKIKIEIQGDSLKIITEIREDTIIKTFVGLNGKTNENGSDTSIYSSKPIDTTIPISNYFLTCREFKIYFDSAKVISYCDSIINNTPADKEDEGFVNWSLVRSATDLRASAKSDKPLEYELGGWNAELLNRFNPLPVNQITNQKAKKLLIVKSSNGIRGQHSYYAITTSGDTSMVGYEQDYWNIDFDVPKDKKDLLLKY